MVMGVCFVLLLMAVFYLCCLSSTFMKVLLISELLTFFMFCISVVTSGVTLGSEFHVLVFLLMLFWDILNSLYLVYKFLMFVFEYMWW